MIMDRERDAYALDTEKDRTLEWVEIERDLRRIVDSQLTDLTAEEWEVTAQAHAQARRELLSSRPTTLAGAAALLAFIAPEIIEDYTPHPLHLTALANLEKALQRAAA